MAPRTHRVGSSLEPENFNLDDVPGSDEPARSDSSGPDIDVNDPDAVPILPKAGAPDIRFFFDKTGSKAVCKECRYVSYVLNSSVF
jgi:hypothetical protein